MTASLRRPQVDADALVDAVSGRTGLDFGGCHRERMVDVVVQLAGAARATSGAAYLAALDRDPAAHHALVDRLTIGETYFFREPAQLELLRRLARDERRSVGDGDRLRIWSAGCATGEEPYTLAMVLAEEGVLAGSTVVGTDLSEVALEHARRATYGRWSLRRCDDRRRRAHFEPAGERFRVPDRYRGAVTLRCANLLAGPPAPARFDLVLCRNVLMYLTAEARRAALHHLRDALVPGGWLLLGSSDPVAQVAGLECHATEGGIAYRRSAAAEGTRPRSRPPVRDGRPAPAPALPLRPRPELRAARPRASEAPETTAPPSLEVDDGGVADAVRALGAGGATAAAGSVLEAAIADDPLDAELRYLAAMLHLGAGRPAEAATAAAAAVYLDPELAVAHLLLGQAEQLSGNRGRARRSFLNALDVLSALPADAVVRHAEGERAGPLATTAAALAGG